MRASAAYFVDLALVAIISLWCSFLASSCLLFHEFPCTSSHSGSALADPSSWHFALNDRIAFHALARWQPDFGSAHLQLALTSHVHLEDHDAQEVAVFSRFSLSDRGCDGCIDCNASILIRSIARIFNLTDTATRTLVGLHLDCRCILHARTLLLGQIRCMQCLLERRLLLLKRKRNRVEVTALCRCRSTIVSWAHFRTQAWEQERV